MSSAVAIVTMFFIQQGFVSFKVWTRVWTFASEVQLFRARESSGEAVVAPAQVSSIITPPVLSVDTQGRLLSQVDRKTEKIRKPSTRKTVRRKPRKKLKK